MGSTSLLLMGVSVLIKVFGLAREKMLAQLFGTGAGADAFLVAFALPMVLSNLSAGAVGTGFIPLYEELRREKSETAAQDFTGNLTNILILLFVLLSALGIFFTPYLIQWMSPGFSGEIFEQAVVITRISLLSMTFTAVGSVFRAYLQVHNRFVLSTVPPMIMNLFLIGAMVLGRYVSAEMMGWGIFAALSLQFLPFIPGVRKTGFRRKKGVDFHDPTIVRMGKTVVPILLSGGVIELNLLVNKSLASQIMVGGISAINYAGRLTDFISGIVITSIVTVFYPGMTKGKETRDQVTGEALSFMALLVFPATVGLMIYHEEIVRLLFGGGAFDGKDVHLTSGLLMIYGPGVIALGIREILCRYRFSCGDVKGPLVNGGIMALLNIALSLVGKKLYGLYGLAAATTTALFVGAILLGFTGGERRFLPSLPTWINLLKILGATVVMGIFAAAIRPVLIGNFEPEQALGLAIACSAALYGIVLLLLNVDEGRRWWERIRGGRR